MATVSASCLHLSFGVLNRRVINGVVLLVMGKVEGKGDQWHGHVTAVTVASDYRRLGVAESLMKHLEDSSERQDCYFMDLYVRVSNAVAIDFYRKLGYMIYREIRGYYSGEENGYDMHKALPRDVQKKSEIPIKVLHQSFPSFLNSIPSNSVFSLHLVFMCYLTQGIVEPSEND